MEMKWIPVKVKKVDAESRTVEGMASTSSPDYGGDVILSSAWKESLRAWKKLGSRPKFLAYHMHATESGHSPVIGKFLELKVLPNGLSFKAEFAETDLGEEHLYLYQNGFMDAFSVGFMSKESEMDPKAIGKLLKRNKIEAEEGAVDRVITKAHLLEVSCVVVGMNMEALTTASAEPVAVKALERLEHMGMGSMGENGWKWLEGVEIPADDPANTSGGTITISTAGTNTIETFDFTGDEEVEELGPAETDPEYDADPLEEKAELPIEESKPTEASVVKAMADMVEVIKNIGVMVSDLKAEVETLRAENKALHSGKAAVKQSAPADASGMTAAELILQDIGDVKAGLGKIRREFGLD